MQVVSCHKSAEYISCARNEFLKPGWIRMNKSSQYPLFNVNDRFSFRNLSKEVSALKYATNLLKLEEIIDMVEMVWSYTTDAVTISR